MTHLVFPSGIIWLYNPEIFFSPCKIAKSIAIKNLDFILNVFIKLLHFLEYEQNMIHATILTNRLYASQRVRHLIQISLTVKRAVNRWCTDVYYNSFVRTFDHQVYR